MRLVAWSLLAGLAFASGQALAAEAPLSVTLHLSGTPYKGAPAFELRADGKVVGSGSLVMPVPADQAFPFTLAGNPQKLSVAFTNDAAKAGEGDRNLYILSITIDGTTYEGSKLTPSPAPAAAVKGKALQFFRNGEAVLNRPAGGWHVAAASASAAPASGACKADSVSVVGFGNGSAAVPAEGRTALAALVQKLSGQPCKFTVTGYTNASSTNALRMAEGRAQEVMAQIVKLGVDKGKVAVGSGGATTQFGARSADNRRVVVSVGG